MANPIKKFKILQDYRTLDYFIPAGSIGTQLLESSVVTFKKECKLFTVNEVMYHSDWFQEVTLDYNEQQGSTMMEFKAGDIIRINERELLIICTYHFEGEKQYKLGDGTVRTERELIKLCSRTQS